MFCNHNGSCENDKVMFPQGFSTSHFLTWEAKPVPQDTGTGPAALYTWPLPGEAYGARISRGHNGVPVSDGLIASFSSQTNSWSGLAFLLRESASNLWAAFKTRNHCFPSWDLASCQVPLGRGRRALGPQSWLVYSKKSVYVYLWDLIKRMIHTRCWMVTIICYENKDSFHIFLLRLCYHKTFFLPLLTIMISFLEIKVDRAFAALHASIPKTCGHIQGSPNWRECDQVCAA